MRICFIDSYSVYKKGERGLYYVISVFIFSIGSYQCAKRENGTILHHQRVDMFQGLLASVHKGKWDYTTSSVCSYVPQTYLMYDKFKWDYTTTSVCSYTFVFHRLRLRVQKGKNITLLRHQCVHMFQIPIGSVQNQTILRHQWVYILHRLIFSVQKGKMGLSSLVCSFVL